ncbi:MAG: putative nucleotidyltransferase substrate binding domain-containing protein [Gammaproteobacteria bacterium]
MDKDISINAAHLHNTETFSGLSPEIIQGLLTHSKIKQLSATDTLIQSGNSYQHQLFIIYQGTLERHEDDGRIKLVSDGEILGLSNYLDGEKYNVTIRSKNNSILLCLAETEVKRLELLHPPLANLFNSIIAKRIKQRSITTHTVTGPLSRKVHEVMKSPIITTSKDITLGEAFKIMDDGKIGALGVINENNTLFGVLTYAGIAEAFVNNKATANSKVSKATCDIPRTIEPEAQLWQANEILDQFGSKYLVVVEQNRPVGLLSQTDINKTLLAENSELQKSINHASDYLSLRRIFDQLVEHAQQFQESTSRPNQAVNRLSNAHLAIQNRVIQLSLHETEQVLGTAPRQYTVIIMGSGGRNEMLLNPDQDNGIIISDSQGQLTKKETEWFKTFTNNVNINLDKAGYILCPGDIMARNPMYHKLLSQWKEQISHLVNKPNAKAARWANIIFDFDSLYGEQDLAVALRQHLLNEVKQQPLLLEYMVEDDAEGRPALGWFNQLVTSSSGEGKGSIDIKRNGLRIIADAARVYALSEGIAENNTLKRLDALVHCGRLSPELVESVRYAYDELLNILLTHQIQQVQQNQSPDKYIYPEQLTEQMRSVLRISMRAIKRLQDQLQGEFGRSAF